LKQAFTASSTRIPSIFPCPNCGGSGNMTDGSISINPGNEPPEYTLPTKCHVCRGKGKVLVYPLPDEMP
jgi:DnaJ-class molecular chaperone